MQRTEWVKQGWITRKQNHGDNGGVIGPPKKQFCPKGHDTQITGRGTSGGCLICTKIAHKKWRDSNKEYIRIKQKEADLKSKYGLTENDYNRMFQIQGGKCAMCLTHQTSLKSKLCVDHNHTNGKVRGLLCVGCNTSLGHYEKRKDLCEIYLGKYL